MIKRYKTKLTVLLSQGLSVSAGILARSSATAFIQVFAMYYSSKQQERDTNILNY